MKILVFDPLIMGHTEIKVPDGICYFCPKCNTRADQNLEYNPNRTLVVNCPHCGVIGFRPIEKSLKEVEEEDFLQNEIKEQMDEINPFFQDISP